MFAILLQGPFKMLSYSHKFSQDGLLSYFLPFNESTDVRKEFVYRGCNYSRLNGLILYGTLNAIEKGVSRELKIYNRFIFLFFACLDNRLISMGRESSRNDL